MIHNHRKKFSAPIEIFFKVRSNIFEVNLNPGKLYHFSTDASRKISELFQTSIPITNSQKNQLFKTQGFYEFFLSEVSLWFNTVFFRGKPQSGKIVPLLN